MGFFFGVRAEGGTAGQEDKDNNKHHAPTKKGQHERKKQYMHQSGIMLYVGRFVFRLLCGIRQLQLCVCVCGMMYVIFNFVINHNVNILRKYETQKRKPKGKKETLYLCTSSNDTLRGLLPPP